MPFGRTGSTLDTGDTAGASKRSHFFKFFIVMEYFFLFLSDNRFKQQRFGRAVFLRLSPIRINRQLRYLFLFITERYTVGVGEDEASD